MAANLSRFLTKADVTDMLGISLPTLNRRLADGSIESFKVGRLVRIDPSAIDRLRSQAR